MGMLDRFERKLEGAVGDAFARLFRSAVVPQEIESALQRSATDGVQELDGGYLLAPNNYVVTIGASDHERLTNDRELTERVFARHLAEFITEQGWQTYAAVRVHFDMSDELHTGQFRASGIIDPDVAPQSGAVWPVAASNQPASIQESPEGNQQSGAGSMTPQRDAVRSIGRHLFGTRRGRSHEETAYPSAYRSGSKGQSASESHGESAYYDPDYGEPIYDDLDFAEESFDQQPEAASPPVHRRPTQWTRQALTAVLELGDGSGRSLTMRKGATVIGRGQDAQFRVPDTGVSRRHAEIRWDGQLALLSDLKSTNGTTVNGSPITVWQLADGDVIRVGHSEIIVRIN
ncbi:DUF3662 and FHA domain-containing protein [Hoyosella altamirensis]|uniref:FHA domain-containing protein n=1 Tax=Hoyosella altamirensis TaxID=616997 RepID=A0A839RPV2_9ACTN|nr:DUF3662 and FHA domain-containing protein [Hoyosella altamirensis]MBB3038046.1 hypothetical protein [Hoyosella altamirensis]